MPLGPSTPPAALQGPLHRPQKPYFELLLPYSKSLGIRWRPRGKGWGGSPGSGAVMRGHWAPTAGQRLWHSRKLPRGQHPQVLRMATQTRWAGSQEAQEGPALHSERQSAPAGQSAQPRGGRVSLQEAPRPGTPPGLKPRQSPRQLPRWPIIVLLTW